jgi:hypothetical protein
MGAKTWMLAYVDGNAPTVLKSAPRLDRAAGEALAKLLFPSAPLEAMDDVDLSYTCPPGDEIFIACFPGLTIVAAKEFGIDRPSRLDPRFLAAAKGRTVYLHAMHSVVDWFAYAVWEDGALKRSLSLSPDTGIVEDIGVRRGFEKAYWSGQHPVFEPGEEVGDYPLDFHPLELGEAALLDLFGYQLEGQISAEEVAPEGIALQRYRRVKPWWKLWGHRSAG